MTTKAQQLAELIDTHDYFLDDVLAAAALLRRQEKALMQAREALEQSWEAMTDHMAKNNIMPMGLVSASATADSSISAINELLGEQT